MRYVSIGIKTTGSNPETCQTVEIGAIADDLKKDFNILNTFRYRIDRNIYSGEPTALADLKDFFGSIHHTLSNPDANDFVGGEKYFASFFKDWLCSRNFDPQNFTVAGLNFIDFTNPFLKKLLGTDDTIKWNKRIFDPNTLYTLPSDLAIPDNALCMSRAAFQIKDIPFSSNGSLFNPYIACRLIRCIQMSKIK